MSTATHETSPAERRRRKVRDTILAAAERVFAREGEAGLSIRRLADEVDYSPAAIYKYFRSKDELVDELKEAFFERILAQIGLMRDTSKPFPQRARLCFAVYVRTALEKPHHYVAAFSGQAPGLAERAAQPAPEPSKKHQAFAEMRGMVQEGVDTGALRLDLDAGDAARSIWAALHGLAMLMAHLPDFPRMRPDEPERDRDAFIDYHADLIARGLEE
ncbi:MAG: TetR/AcrR family transcriptional regulator [Pseudomonadota bacterium]